MCGIFGYSVHEWDDRLETAMAILAIQNENRGKDAFGWTNGKTIFKDGGPITDGFHEIPFQTELVGAFHTRAGTSGAKSAKNNAHPWQMGDIIGMQNGFVANHFEMNKLYDRKFEVDSMHLVAHMAEFGHILDLQFAGVFLYFKDGRGPFYFRNTHRPLEVIKLADGLGVMWSSEYGHLLRAAKMAGLTRESVFQIAPSYHVYELRADGLFDTGDKVQCEDIPKKEPVIIPAQQQGMRRYHYMDGVGMFPGDLWGDEDESFDGNKVLPDETGGHPQQQTRQSKKDKKPQKKRVEDVGQWRRLPGMRDEVWVPCFHSRGDTLIYNGNKTHSPHYSCGCYKNLNYSKSWPIMWRPLGEWRDNQWYDCGHREPFNN